MSCPRCNNTGRVTDRVDRDPYGPVPYFARIHGFCDCEAGWDLKAREIIAKSDAFEAHCAANAFADDHMTPPDWARH